MKAAGVAVVARVELEGRYAGKRDTYANAVVRALAELEREGADMSSRLAITIGTDHPEYPGKVLVEAKAAAAVQHPDDCPGCPIAHDTDE